MPVSPNGMAALNGGEEQAPQQQPQAQGGQPKGNPLETVMTQWVSGTYGLAALSPQGIRDQLTSANDHFSAMVEGALSSQRGPALEARRAWEEAATGALHANRQRLLEYGMIWQDQEMPIEQKMAQVRETAMRWGDNNVANLAASPEHFTTFGKMYDLQQKQHEQAEQSTKSLDEMIKTVEAKLPKQQGAQGLPPIDKFLQ